MGAHDSFIKRLFAEPALASQLFEVVLPPDVVRHLDWSTLKPISGALPDKKSEFHADLLFQVQLAGPPRPGSAALLSVLFEHQSTSHQSMPLRLLGYMVRSWEAQRERAPDAPLRLFIPVVLSHDPRGWNAPVRLAQLFAPEVAELAPLRALVPDFGFFLEDVSRRSDAQIQSLALSALLKLSFWALRDARTPQRLLGTLGAWGQSLAELLATENGAAALAVVFDYISRVADLEPGQLDGALRRVLPPGETLMPTLAERWMQMGEARGFEKGEARGFEKGEARGFEKGEARGLAASVLRILERRGLALSEAQRQRVLGCQEIATLEAWFDRALEIASVDELLG
ncbi:MAG TPA: Rpn family recombination-promoting nuclease/putative transposase [Polyangiaceae bacterium]|nr:Rpn family recombination-promoting nuclease/putative transposase [Polyangiaceae bacterium]